jgi:hypothetical protein
MTGTRTESLADLAATFQAHIKELRSAGDLAALLAAAEAGTAEIEQRVGKDWNDAGLEALKAVKRAQYNVAADCWPGWSVSDRPADPQILVRALELAKRSVALVSQLGLGRMQEGTGIWLCGALELAVGRHVEAYNAFILAREHYIAAQAPGLTLLVEGYIALLCEVAGQQVPAWKDDLEQVCAKIDTGGFEDGAEWIEQLRTARRVFTRA